MPSVKYTMSPDQARALTEIGRWYRSKSSQYLTLGGYAGTGKTTLIAYLRQALQDNFGDTSVAFAAYTGKAAQVLRHRLRTAKALKKSDHLSTIHSLIYDAHVDQSGQTHWELKDELDCDLIIVDEASMVDETIWQDLLSFDIPILAVGDHGQLPPINSSFNLMADPVVRLEQIWRQEAASPIITVATMARQSGRIPVGVYGDEVVKLDRGNSETGQRVEELLEGWNDDLLVLCGYNHTRVKLNAAIRALKGFETPDPSPGDRVVCLRNNRAHKIYNGLVGTITQIEPADNDPDKQWYEAMIRFDNEHLDYSGPVLRAQFGAKEKVTDMPKKQGKRQGDLFDFGYCLTVHKAQGSQAPAVLLFEERFPKMSESDWRRWLYTAVTRAEERLTIVGAD
jgi:ATP-dependent exoDNAse (exonuclease V) alpha subunit